jgi:hypothetical protein
MALWELFRRSWSSILKHALLLLIGVWGAYLIDPFVSESDFFNVLSTLQNMSAAVFTLSGIWIAYMYPKALDAFTNPEKVTLLEGTEHAKRVKFLVLIIFSSALVLVGVLCISFIYPILQKIPLLIPYASTLKIGYLTLIWYLSVIQIKAIGGIMLSNIEFVYGLGVKKAEQDAIEDLSR